MPGQGLARSIELTPESGGRASGGWLGRMLAELTGFEDTQGRVRLHTVSLIRWVAVIGQLFTILFVHFSLGIVLPLSALLPAVALSAAVNLLLSLGLKATTRLPERSAAALFALDVLQLAYLLALTGGVQNPFAVLLLVPLALAAVTLDVRSTVGVTLLTLVCVAALAMYAGPLPWRAGGLTLPALYRVGGWAALSLAIMLIAVFAWSVAEEARHIGFAHAYLEHHSSRLNRVDRAVMSIVTPILMRWLAQVILVPSRRARRDMGIPRHVIKDVYWRDDESRAALRDMFGDVRMLAGNAGLMNPVSRRTWRLLGIDGRPSRFRSEPAPVG